MAVAKTALREMRRHREQTVLHGVSFLFARSSGCDNRLSNRCLARETDACRVAMNRLNVARRYRPRRIVAQPSGGKNEPGRLVPASAPARNRELALPRGGNDRPS